MTRSFAATLVQFSPRALLVGAIDRLLAWQARAEEAQQLRGMDDRQLRDVGLSRADIERILRHGPGQL